MIVVVGETLVDLGEGPDGSRSALPGGAPFNVAVGLGRLEIPALLITEIGHDEYAEPLLEAIHAADVELLAGPTEHGRTPTAVVSFRDGEPVYDLDVSWHLAHQELPNCDALHVGSLGTVLEPGRDSVLDLVEQAWALDVFVSYDPNVRGALLTDREQAWRDVESLADRAHLVKISAADVELLHPGADPDDIARSLLTGDRTEIVILTRGAAGATAYVEDLVVSVPGIEVAVVDTIGAGDAFMAATLAVLQESGSFGRYAGGVPHDRETVLHLLSAANEAAALSCTRAGAVPPTRSELRASWPD